VKYTATITFEFESDSPTDACDLAFNAAEHLLDTFNGDGSISQITHIDVEPSTTVEEPK